MVIANPINNMQRRFNELCELGGGPGGGPARSRLQDLLHRDGAQLTSMAHDDITEHLHEYSDRNPWHVCFAVGISWGHLAKLDLEFTGAAVGLLEHWNDADLRRARSFHLERGAAPIEGSLRGGHMMFSQVPLADSLPETLQQYRRAQTQWFQPIVGSDRPPYIGSWNATAMFMIALFSNEALGRQLTSPVVSLPPGGPIYNALGILHRVHALSRRPSGSDLDDEAVELGAIYENNALFEEIHRGHAGWSLLDVHGGLYMLGTRYLPSANWF